ncbi:MAG: manganese efflux pump [Bacteroidales bacterium]|nr:manganese efflux pump [Bacteroidales bacterium]
MTLSVLDSIVLSFAFSVNMFLVSVAAAKGGGMRYTKGILQSLLLICFQCAFLYVGLWITGLFRIGDMEYDKWLTSGMLMIIAIKLAVNAIKKSGAKDTVVVKELKSMLFLAVAAAMNTFIIGMGLGFTYDTEGFGLAIVATAILGFLVSLMGVFMGRQNSKVPMRLLIGAEALLFAELAIKMFFE